MAVSVVVVSSRDRSKANLCILLWKSMWFGFVPCLPLETSLIYVSEEFLSGWFCRFNVDWKLRF